MSGTFRQATDDDDDAAEPEARLTPVATVDAPTSDQAPAVAAPSSVAAASSLSDSSLSTSSSITLPGHRSAAGRRSGRAQSYWQSVADIGRQVAEALDYAHKQGILHRDIKPSNLLLDLRGTVWVTDFGLAKVAGPGGDNITHPGDILGTLRYMPPEAFDGKSDIRSDVYSLGVTMYELLALRPAFEEKDRNKLVKQVTTGEPAALDKVARDTPRDLVTIIHKAIDREPGRRYATAVDLASDLQRFLDDEPIQARRQTQLERCVRWARRHPGIAILGGALAAVLILATIASLLAANYFNRLRLDAAQAAHNERHAREEADRSRQEESRQRQRADDEASSARKAEGEARAQLARAEWLVYAGKLSLAQSDFETADGALALQFLDECPWNLRGWEHRYLWTRINAKQTFEHPGAVDGVAFSPDGKRILTGCRDSTMARIWDIQTGRELFSVRHGVAIRSVAFSADGKRFITGAGDVGQPGSAKVWHAETGRELLTITGQVGWVLSVAFSPDGKRIVTGDGDVFNPGAAKVWDAETGKNLQNCAHQRRVWSVAFSPDGKRIVSASGDETARVWDAQTGQELLTLRGHTGEVLCAALSSDGKRLVTGGMDRTMKLWDAATGKEILTLKGHTGWVRSAAFSPGDQRIVSGSVDTTVRVWDVATGQETLALKGHAGDVWSVAFSPDGKRIVSSSEDRTAKVWDADRGQKVLALPVEAGNVRGLAFSPDSQHLAAGSSVWDAATGQKLLELKEARGPMAFSLDGKRIVTGSHDKRARVWNVATGQELLALSGHTGDVLGATFSRDGTHIATAGYHQDEPGAVRVWDAATGRQVLALDALRARAWSVAFSPDGRRIVTGDDRKAKVWDVATGRQVLDLSGHTHEVWCVAYSFDGKHIVTGCLDKMVRVFDAETGQIVLTLKGHTLGVWSATFSRDGKRIFSGSQDGTVRVWEAGKGQELLALKGNSPVFTTAFSADGKRLAAGNDDGIVRVWVAEKGQAPRNHAERIEWMKDRLPALLREEEQPADDSERLTLARLAVSRQRFALAARLWTEALASNPKLGDDREAQHRYHAARAACRAAGLPKDAPPLDGPARAKLRQQALDWLKAELTAWGRLLEVGSPKDQQVMVFTVSGWKHDVDLATIRDDPDLATLPADEQQAFKALWADVAAFLKTANAKHGAFLQERLPEARQRVPDSPELAYLLAGIGRAHLEQEQWAQAEPYLRECLAIREKIQPDSWTTFNTYSSLGGSLLGQKRYAQARPLLLKGYQGMKEREKTIPPIGKDRLPEALERLIDLYIITNEPDQVKKWQADRAKKLVAAPLPET